MSHYQKSHTLERDSLGRLVLIDASGNYHVGVYPVRAFPITAPGAGISIMDQSGKELCWFDNLGLLDATSKRKLPLPERSPFPSSTQTPRLE
jgi:hypothetical protein